MGIFDAFKSKIKTFGKLHCLNTRDWNDGYKTDTKGIISFVKEQTKNKSESEFINFLKKRPEYRKFEDKNISSTLNKITCTKYNSKDDTLLPKINSFVYPKNFVDKHLKSVCAFKILETKMAVEDGKVKKGNFKILTILWIQNQTKPERTIGGKDVGYSNRIRDLSFQFIVLDKMEYEHLKPWGKMYSNTKGEEYAAAWDKGDMYNAIFGDDGIFATKKRKKYPVNYFQAFLAFEE